MITLSEVGKNFEGKWIFRGTTLNVKKGESFVILGPSGSGKSVLLKILAGLILPDEGSVQVGTRNIGMLFQKNALFDSLTVEENLLFPLKERARITGAKAKSLAEHFLRAVNLENSGKLYPDEISGGMQKRLGIARALVVSPEVILYDEPTAGLDPITSRTIAELIQSLREETGSTLVTVTNDIQRAYQLGDQICLLAQQKLRIGGTPNEVKNTSDPYFKQFILGLKEGPLEHPI